MSSARNQNEKRFSSVYGVNITEWNLSHPQKECTLKIRSQGAPFENACPLFFPMFSCDTRVRVSHKKMRKKKSHRLNNALIAEQGIPEISGPLSSASGRCLFLWHHHPTQTWQESWVMVRWFVSATHDKVSDHHLHHK